MSGLNDSTGLFEDVGSVLRDWDFWLVFQWILVLGFSVDLGRWFSVDSGAWFFKGFSGFSWMLAVDFQGFGYQFLRIGSCSVSLGFGSFRSVFRGFGFVLLADTKMRIGWGEWKFFRLGMGFARRMELLPDEGGEAGLGTGGVPAPRTV